MKEIKITDKDLEELIYKVNDFLNSKESCGDDDYEWYTYDEKNNSIYYKCCGNDNWEFDGFAIKNGECKYEFNFTDYGDETFSYGFLTKH